MIVQLADNRDYSIAKFISCEHALSSCQSSLSFIFSFSYIDNHRMLKKTTKITVKYYHPCFDISFCLLRYMLKFDPKLNLKLDHHTYTENR